VPPAFNPFAVDDGADPLSNNPFAPPPKVRASVGADAPRKLQLLGRGLGVFGSYAKVLLVEDQAVAYSQFGPLTAYPRAQRLRDLYPQLPAAPLPAVITCIATTGEARGAGWGLRLVEGVCDDLSSRGFSAVEAYPEPRANPDATSAANPEFWRRAGFSIVIEDERYPVARRELG
jgi:ribosomal protein S18 acetylase RimI-like enzyme